MPAKGDSIPLIERLLSKISPEPNSGCWIWTESVGNGGYGSIRSELGWEGAHRAAYRLFRGPIPDGMDLDHLCRVRCCCNPHHLEPVTRQENLLRGENCRKDCCHAGHPYPENLRIRPDTGKRQCMECARIRDRKRRPGEYSSIELRTMGICRRGHAMTGDNIHTEKPSGKKRCLKCLRIKDARRKLRHQIPVL